jgi:hypothetical protein
MRRHRANHRDPLVRGVRGKADALCEADRDCSRNDASNKASRSGASRYLPSGTLVSALTPLSGNHENEFLPLRQP